MTDHKESEQDKRRLAAELKRTKAAYELAKQEFELARERYEDLGPTHPDGSLALAIRILNRERRVYLKALMDFNRRILDKKLPSEQGSKLP